jgi:hypothetical protein
MVLFEVDEIVVIKGLRFRVRRWTRNGRLFLKRVGGGVKRDVVVSLDADADYASAIADAEYEAEQEAAMGEYEAEMRDAEQAEADYQADQDAQYRNDGW